MLGFKKKCEYCKMEIEKDKQISENVEVYGRTDTPKRHFCSQEHLEFYKKAAAELMKTRKPMVCKRCLK